MNDTEHSGVASPVDATSAERRVNRLAAERTSLFVRAASNLGLSTIDQQRLSMIERELDDCFLARRRQRAERDAGRFGAERRFLSPRSGSGATS